ncbi:MAG: ABC transporter substrate-binding protein, partial [Desulfobacterales bacterium]|nr:ABC transporter substrate-binding protein [Desulfobacterales bacterium]
MSKLHTIFISLLSFVLLSVFSGPAMGKDKVNLQLIWKNQFQFAGYYVAKELGFYDNLGLDVDIKEYESGINVTRDVVEGKADFGVGRSSLIVEKMEEKPIVLLAAIFQHSPIILLAKERPDIQTISDLKGKRIMVADDEVGMASLTAMLMANRIGDNDYKKQRHTFNITDLVNEKTDAIAAYISNEPFQMEKQGVDYRVFSPQAYGFDFYSDILFTSEKMLKENPQLVERFYQASIQGWEYAFANIEKTAHLIFE